MAALGAWLWQLMGRRGQPLIARVAVLALCLVNPMTYRALYWGHPEELLCAAMVVAALFTTWLTVFDDETPKLVSPL